MMFCGNILASAVLGPLSFKERDGVRMGLYHGLVTPIPTLILPLKGRKLACP
jgi:hypothetical protein